MPRVHAESVRHGLAVRTDDATSQPWIDRLHLRGYRTDAAKAPEPTTLVWTLPMCRSRWPWCSGPPAQATRTDEDVTMLHRTPLAIVLGTLLLTGCTQSEAAFSAGATAIAADYRHACIVRDNRTVACWGDNRTAQLGDGTTDDSFDDLRTVTDIYDVRELTVGEDFSCAVAQRAEVRCWGLNLLGQVGNGQILAIAGPTTPVPEVTGSIGLAAGRNHTCAVAADGRVRCWGANDSGQLGDGSRADRVSPVEVVDIDNAVSLSAGAGFTCALLEDGEVTCWGLNSVGQLGVGDREDRSEPSTVSDLDRVVAIDSQLASTCAVRNDGSVWCWGSDYHSGEPSTAVPRRVDGISGAKVVTVGEQRSCGLTQSGILCWNHGSSAVPAPTDSTDVVDLALFGPSLCTVSRAGEVTCRPPG